MGRTSQQLAIRIHKVVGLPIQRHAQVWAPIQVDEEGLLLSHHYVALTAQAESFGIAVLKFCRMAENSCTQAWALANSPRSSCSASLTRRILRSGGRSFQ